MKKTLSNMLVKRRNAISAGPRRGQGGFAVLPLLLLAVIIGGALVAWAATSRSNTSAAQDGNNKVMASSIIDEGKSQEQTFTNLVTNGVTPSSVTYDTTSGQGIFDPTVGIIKPIPQGNAMLPAVSLGSTEGFWVYNKNFKGNGIGTQAGADYVVTLAGIKNGVCSKINDVLYSLGSTTAPPSVGVAESGFVGGATVATPVSTGTPDLSSTAAVLNWPAGCVQTSDGKYVYFHIVNAS
ncbi:hypothetical protein AB4Y45_33120 [Paraburkholderia sp. EG287A]|uniref:hypothetical protein n=1 Tax=Paraburkholderia sp. EG287A TaxID=3237012 RepID=UPI0034D220FA